MNKFTIGAEVGRRAWDSTPEAATGGAQILSLRLRLLVTVIQLEFDIALIVVVHEAFSIITTIITAAPDVVAVVVDVGVVVVVGVIN